MSLSEWFVKAGGAILMVIGFAVLLSTFGWFGVSPFTGLMLLIPFFGGLLLIGAGVIIIRGGSITA